jgi:hypothetical protein
MVLKLERASPPSTINQTPSTSFDHFSVKEKDEASPLRECARDSLNAFILRFAGVEGFLV